MLPCGSSTSFGISTAFAMLSPSKRQVVYALLTRSPLSTMINHNTPFDLHVLSTPPAFVLSQDQTLHKMYYREPWWLNIVKEIVIAICNRLLVRRDYHRRTTFGISDSHIAEAMALCLPHIWLESFRWFIFALFSFQRTPCCLFETASI